MTSRAIALIIASLCCFGSATAWGQIFTCVDAKGRKLTSDRPIAECADRDQKEFNSSGSLKRTVKPAMTVEEQRVFDEKQKALAEDQARQAEEKRKDRALLTRYPSRTVHDKERADTLTKVDDVIKSSNKRQDELAAQRTVINTELEFYKKDPSKLPLSLKRQIEDNDNNVAVQKRFVADQDNEKKRINARFDGELTRLKVLWPLMGAVSTPGSVKK